MAAIVLLAFVSIAVCQRNALAKSLSCCGSGAASTESGLGYPWTNLSSLGAAMKDGIAACYCDRSQNRRFLRQPLVIGRICSVASRSPSPAGPRH